MPARWCAMATCEETSPCFSRPREISEILPLLDEAAPPGCLRFANARKGVGTQAAKCDGRTSCATSCVAECRDDDTNAGPTFSTATPLEIGGGPAEALCTSRGLISEALQGCGDPDAPRTRPVWRTRARPCGCGAGRSRKRGLLSRTAAAGPLVLTSLCLEPSSVEEAPTGSSVVAERVLTCPP